MSMAALGKGLLLFSVLFFSEAHQQTFLRHGSSRSAVERSAQKVDSKPGQVSATPPLAASTLDEKPPAADDNNTKSNATIETIGTKHNNQLFDKPDKTPPVIATADDASNTTLKNESSTNSTNSTKAVNNNKISKNKKRKKRKKNQLKEGTDNSEVDSKVNASLFLENIENVVETNTSSSGDSDHTGEEDVEDSVTTSSVSDGVDGPTPRSWPELVGMDALKAEDIITQEMDGKVDIFIYDKDAFVTQEYVPTRVRMFVNPDNTVALIPMVG